MAEFKFSCPHCGQSIQCDERWSGQRLPCPGCHTTMIVPELASPGPPIAPPPAAPRPQARPTVPRSAQPSGYSAKKLAAIAGGMLAFGVLYYFGLGWADALQKRFNEKSHRLAANSGGGELVHIAKLYEVLDKTEPDAMGLNNPNRLMKRRGISAADKLLQPYTPPPNPAEKLPVLPAEWTLDLQAAKIPEGRANGAISGTNFVIQAASLQSSGGAVILSLRQSDNAARPRVFHLPERERRRNRIGPHLEHFQGNQGQRHAAGGETLATERSLRAGAKDLHLRLCDATGTGQSFQQLDSRKNLSFPCPTKRRLSWPACSTSNRPAALEAQPSILQRDGLQCAISRPLRGKHALHEIDASDLPLPKVAVLFSGQSLRHLSPSRWIQFPCSTDRQMGMEWTVLANATAGQQMGVNRLFQAFQGPQIARQAGPDICGRLRFGKHPNPATRTLCCRCPWQAASKADPISGMRAMGIAPRKFNVRWICSGWVHRIARAGMPFARPATAARRLVTM